MSCFCCLSPATKRPTRLWRSGVATTRAAAGGQVTLNPLPHVRRETLGMIAIPLFSFALNGWMLGLGVGSV